MCQCETKSPLSATTASSVTESCSVMKRIAVCSRVFKSAAVCGSVLQCVATCFEEIPKAADASCVTVRCSEVHLGAVRCNVLQLRCPVSMLASCPIIRHCKTLQDTARHCKTLQDTARYCKTHARLLSRFCTQHEGSQYGVATID